MVVRIGIYYSNTGGGHSDAAAAVKAGIESVIEQEGLIDNYHIFTQALIEQSHPFNQCLVSFYNYLARHHTTWVKYLYKLIHLMRPESNLYGLCRSNLHNLLKQEQPTLIVSVHPLLAEALCRARDEVLDPSVKIAVVVTDPNYRLWRAWACNKVDLLIAPNNVVKERLIEFGMDKDKIQVLGMPVHSMFLSPPQASRTRLLTRLNLSPDTFTICINCGWAGNSHHIDAIKALSKCKKKIQVIFICGHNKDLYRKALSKARESNIPIRILSYYTPMSDLMQAVDVMVTKAGGLTTYQALATRLPLILDNTIEPMPQEEPTMQMLVECNMATKLDKPEDLPKIIDSIELRSRNFPLPLTYQLNLTDSAISQISTSLLKLID